MATAQVVAAPLHAPPHPLKRAFGAGTAVSVTTVPLSKVDEQIVGQLTAPGLLLTAPAADPRTVTVRATGSGGLGVVAVASLEYGEQPTVLHARTR